MWVQLRMGIGRNTTELGHWEQQCGENSGRRCRVAFTSSENMRSSVETGLLKGLRGLTSSFFLPIILDANLQGCALSERLLPHAILSTWAQPLDT